jgi:hypothetical protein
MWRNNQIAEAATFVQYVLHSTYNPLGTLSWLVAHVSRIQYVDAVFVAYRYVVLC